MAKLLILFVIVTFILVLIDLLSGFRYGVLSILAVLFNLIFVFLILFLYAHEYDLFVVITAVVIVIITVGCVAFVFDKRRKKKKYNKKYDNVIEVDDDFWK
ncbi:hypothetical protein M1N04_01450 [Peptococcaceae bacterium]|nr:hypothetical protein [Peptococcaceae bacterium]